MESPNILGELAKAAMEAELMHPGEKLKVNTHERASQVLQQRIPTQKVLTLLERAEEIEEEINLLRTDVHLKLHAITNMLADFSSAVHLMANDLSSKVHGK